MSSSPLSPNDAVIAPWLSIVGLGADGKRSLSPAACRAIERAEWVAGSERQLGLVDSLVRGERFVWPSPLATGIEQLFARRRRASCVLASGDPFFFGIGATLAPRLSAGEFTCYPAPSSVSLAAARLGWPLQDTDLISLHGRDLHGVIRYLQPGRRLLVLAWDRRTAAQLAQLLAARGFGPSRMHVLEDLGGSGERIRASRADAFALAEVADLNLIALEVVAAPGAFVLPWRASLPDSAFEHDGQLTKREIRALTLSALEPHPGARLWDVGAGAGSIGIEWMLCHPACEAVAVEADAARCERIRNNARSLGVPGLSVVETTAPRGLDALPPPAAVFIGGGAGDAQVFETCWNALRPGGRLVINAVSIETEILVATWHAQFGGELHRYTIETAAPLGTLRGFRPAMTVTQWAVDKA